MQKMEMKSGTILYRSRGGSILWTVLYLIDALVCIFLACIVFMVMEEYELLLVLRYGRGVYIIPWILLIAGAVSMVGFVNLLLSKIIIFSDHVEGTPFSWFRRTTMYVERNQIQSVEIDTKRSWLIIHTTAGKYKMPCKDVRTAYQLLTGRAGSYQQVVRPGNSPLPNINVQNAGSSKRVCPNCMQEVPNIAAFCPHCGHALKNGNSAGEMS